MFHHHPFQKRVAAFASILASKYLLLCIAQMVLLNKLCRFLKMVTRPLPSARDVQNS